MQILPLLQAAADTFGKGYQGGWAMLGAGVGAGIASVGAGIGIGRIGGQAMDGIARQPAEKGSIFTNALVLSAFIEGVALFAVVVALMIVLKY